MQLRLGVSSLAAGDGPKVPCMLSTYFTTKLHQPSDTAFLDTDRTLCRKYPRTLKDRPVLFLLDVLHLVQCLDGLYGPAG